MMVLISMGGFYMESCRIFDMGYKEVIDLESGARLGYVYDAQVDLETGRVQSLFVPGKAKLFGLLGREEDTIIPWESIEKIGDDIILVRGGQRLLPAPRASRRRY